MGTSLLALAASRTLYGLRRCEQDALALADWLGDRVSLLDVKAGVCVTSAGLGASLRWLHEQAPSGDDLLVYYTGHGGWKSNGSFLYLQDGALPAAAFQPLIAQLSGRRVTVILDACGSGGMLPLPMEAVATTGPSLKDNTRRPILSDDLSLIEISAPGLTDAPPPAEIRLLAASTASGVAAYRVSTGSHFTEVLRSLGAAAWESSMTELVALLAASVSADFPFSWGGTGGLGEPLVRPGDSR